MPDRVRSTEASEAWRAVLTAFTGVNRILADELETETDLSLDRYEILLMLFGAGDGGLQPSELADRRRLSRSGATRLIDRLVDEGLVLRRACEEDGRVSFVELTEHGRDRFVAAGRIHLRGIEQHFGDRLTQTDMADLRRILAKVDPGGA